MSEETKTTKMRFTEDKFYNHDVIYQKDKIYEVPNNMVERWLKRGGEILEITETELPVEGPLVEDKDEPVGGEDGENTEPKENVEAPKEKVDDRKVAAKPVVAVNKRPVPPVVKRR